YSKQKSKGYAAVCDEISRHLADLEVGLLTGGEPSMGTLLDHLTQSDSAQLRLCTSEALAYLNYLRRFAKSKKGGENAHPNEP
ncbi:MAG: type III-B CRISPR module-associated protein Cmr5, partial [Acidobacteriota bacterium]